MSWYVTINLVCAAASVCSAPPPAVSQEPAVLAVAPAAVTIVGLGSPQVQIAAGYSISGACHSPSGEQTCPPGWSQHEDSCFLIPAQRSSWYMAHHHCASMERRARLASVHGASSQFVQDLVAAFGATTGVWVGLSRPSHSADWTWSDATGVDHLAWDQGEPSNIEHENCAHLGWPGYSRERLHDNRCHVVMNMLCQINLE